MKTQFTQEDITQVKRMLEATTMRVFANTQPRLHSTVTDNDTIVVDEFYITLETVYAPGGEYDYERDYNIYRLSVEVTIPSNSRMEPDDVDIKELNTAQTLDEAVRMAINCTIATMIDSAQEADAMAAAYAADN